MQSNLEALKMQFKQQGIEKPYRKDTDYRAMIFILGALNVFMSQILLIMVMADLISN